MEIEHFLGGMWADTFGFSHLSEASLLYGSCPALGGCGGHLLLGEAMCYFQFIVFTSCVGHGLLELVDFTE